jgi:hypothetical protein
MYAVLIVLVAFSMLNTMLMSVLERTQDVVNGQDLYSRLLRGELFTTGRYYISGSVLVEMTPLLQLSPTLFINLGDGREFGGLFTNAADGRILRFSNALFARLAWCF